MNRVYQTLFGERVGTPTSGNCYPACLASLLELPLDRVPHFYGEMTPIEVETRSFDLVNRRVVEWLKTRGYRILGFDWPMNGASHRYLSGALAIFSGKSPRGNFTHAVIGRIGEESGDWSPVFDPRRTSGEPEFLASDPFMVEVLFTTPGDAGILGETVVEMTQRRTAKAGDHPEVAAALNAMDDAFEHAHRREVPGEFHPHVVHQTIDGKLIDVALPAEPMDDEPMVGLHESEDPQ